MTREEPRLFPGIFAAPRASSIGAGNFVLATSSSTSLKEFVMFKVRSTTTQVMAAVLATGCFALALGARAEASPTSMGMQTAGADATACKTARLSAWFERQRQLTDGDTVAGPIATPRECTVTQGTNAANEAAPDKKLVVVSKAPRQGFPGGYEGVTLGGA
jgi:hypothetical protein